MSFSGQRFKLGLVGSFNGNENFDDIPVGQMTINSKNVNNHNGVVEKRGGTALEGSLIAGNPDCLGGGQLVLENGTQHDYFAGSDGELYRDGSSIQSSRSATAKVHFTVADKKMFICNGVDAVKVDTGSSLATIATPAADWTGTDQPIKMIVHNKGASRRMFAWGVAGKKNTLYYSKLNDFQDFTDASAGTINVDIKEGNGIINCVSKDGNLYIFGRDQSYVLLDDNTDITTWGTIATAWEGGVHSPRLMIEVRNDIYAITTNLEIYSIATAEQLRNYKRASIIRPFFIHNWITNNINKLAIDDFHATFDPKTDALKIWMRRSGQSENDIAIVYYPDTNTWTAPHDAIDNADDSGYHAAASWNALNSSGEEVLRTGDYNGGTWELENDTKKDNLNGYASELRTTWVDMGLFGINKLFDEHWPAVFHFISRGDFQIDLRWFVDNTEQTSKTVSLGANSAALGSFVLGTDSLGSIGLSKQEVELGAVGEKIRFYISNDGAGEDFALSHIVLPFQPRGVERVNV
jgi:hypothetical protein